MSSFLSPLPAQNSAQEHQLNPPGGVQHHLLLLLLLLQMRQAAVPVALWGLLLGRTEMHCCAWQQQQRRQWQQ
jgi:hypothetical protein